MRIDRSYPARLEDVTLRHAESLSPDGVTVGPFRTRLRPMARGGAEVTTARAAEMLGVSSGTVRAQINKRKLAAEKRGRDLFIQVREIERYARDVQPRRRGGRRPRSSAS